jgi:hypothetical protein
MPGNAKYAQDLNKMHGKILRINSDSTIPSDNPFKDHLCGAMATVTAEGIDWYPGTDILWETEHGLQGLTDRGGDEVNVILKGKNYGWPIVSHEESRRGWFLRCWYLLQQKLLHQEFLLNPDKIPEYKNNFFFGCLRGEELSGLL